MRIPVVMSIICFAGTLLAQSSQLSPNTGYRAEYRATFQPTDELIAHEMYKEVRFISSDGSWHIFRQTSDGKTTRKLGDPVRGIFIVDAEGSKLLREQPYAAIHHLTPHPTLKEPAVGETMTKFLGLHVEIIEKTTEDGKIQIYRARELNGDVVRLVRHSKNGIFVLELTKIVMGDPTDEDLGRSFLRSPANPN